METTSDPGRVQLSPSAADLLRLSLPADLALEPRGQIAVKGKVRTTVGLPTTNPIPFGDFLWARQPSQNTGRHAQ